MALQDDINAAVTVWVQALQAQQAAQAALVPANAAVLAAFAAVRSAMQGALAGQTVDVITIGAALKVANDAYSAAQVAIPPLQAAADAAVLALATLLAPPLGTTTDAVIATLNNAAAP